MTDEPIAPEVDFRGEPLVFIISQHRSGSTLLQRVLGGHSQIRTGAETFLLLHPLYALKTTGFRAEYREWDARVAVSDYLEHFAGGSETYIDALRAMAAVLYGRALDDRAERYFLDKTPRYTLIIPELHRLLPDAKFIFLLRNPLSILASQLERFQLPTNFQNLTHIRNETILAPPRILAGMDLVGDDAIVVRYEELVTDPDRVVGDICSRLGLDFEPAMIEYGDRPDPPGRGGFFDHRGIPKHRRPTTESLEKWRSLGDDPQRRHIARSFLLELGPEVVEGLGYSFDELLDVVRPTEDGDRGVTCSWSALMVPAAEPDADLDAFPGAAGFPPSPPLRRVRPATPPRISVIVPTHANPERLERTLRSVIIQGQPNIDLIIAVDATQTGHESIVAKYEPWCSTVTEPASGGFADAVQRGLAYATGEVLTWLRPDEEYLPWTLSTVGAILADRTEVEWLIGSQHLLLDGNAQPIGQVPTPHSLTTWLHTASGGAPSRLAPLRFTFLRTTLWYRAGLTLDATLVDAADCDLTIQVAAHAKPVMAPLALGAVNTEPWWLAARWADEAEEYVGTLDTSAISPAPFARLHRDVRAERWRVSNAAAATT